VTIQQNVTSAAATLTVNAAALRDDHDGALNQTVTREDGELHGGGGGTHR